MFNSKLNREKGSDLRCGEARLCVLRGQPVAMASGAPWGSGAGGATRWVCGAGPSGRGQRKAPIPSMLRRLVVEVENYDRVIVICCRKN